MKREWQGRERMREMIQVSSIAMRFCRCQGIGKLEYERKDGVNQTGQSGYLRIVESYCTTRGETLGNRYAGVDVSRRKLTKAVVSSDSRPFWAWRIRSQGRISSAG